MKFTTRDICWTMLAIGLLLGWYVDRRVIIDAFDEMIRKRHNYKWIGGGVPYGRSYERSPWIEEEIEFDKRVAQKVKELTFEVEQETDGRWIAEAPTLPGVMAYGESREEALQRAKALAILVIESRNDDVDLFTK